jgi:hypothetical protein
MNFEGEVRTEHVGSLGFTVLRLALCLAL